MMKLLKIYLNICLCSLLLISFFQEVKSWSENDTPIYQLSIGGFTSNGEFNYPSDVTLDSQGNIYVIETFNDRVQKFDALGNNLLTFGEFGTGDGQFQDASGIFVDSSGYIYIADSSNHRIQKFNSSGEFVFKFGTNGSGDGQFNRPKSLFVDSEGNIYVADTYNHRIQKFDSLGNFLLKFGTNGTGNLQFKNPWDVFVDSGGNIFVADYMNHRISKFDSTGAFLLKFGTSGTGDLNFSYPISVFVDSGGNIFVSENGNSRIKKHDSSGNYLMKFGTNGYGDGQFLYTNGIHVDGSGNVYTTDTDRGVVQIFNSSGVFVKKFGDDILANGKFYYPFRVDTDNQGNVYVVEGYGNRVQKFNSEGEYILKFGSSGTGDGQLYSPRGIDVDSSGNIYVADTSNNRVQKFDSNGNFIMKFGSFGTADGQFKGPYQVFVDSGGNIFVTDTTNHRIQKFNSAGVFQMKFGVQGSGDGQLYYPKDIYVDSLGNIFVLDGYSRIQKFTSSGTFVSKYGSSGTGDGQFISPQAFSVDSNGNLFVIDTMNQRVQMLDSSGNFVMKFGTIRSHTNYTFFNAYGINIDSDLNLYVADSFNQRIQKFTFDRVSPTGSISVLNEPIKTKTQDITLSLSASDQLSGVYQMRISQDSNFTDTTWVPYSTSHDFTLSSGDGLKTIYVQYVDNRTNYSVVYSTNIFLDTQAPGKVSISGLGLIKNIPEKDSLKYYFFNPRLSIEGVGEDGAQVYFKVGSNIYSTYIQSDGTFSLVTSSPTLNFGENVIEYYQLDSVGNKSESRYLTVIVGVEYFPKWLLVSLGLEEEEVIIETVPQEQEISETEEEVIEEDITKEENTQQPVEQEKSNEPFPAIQAVENARRVFKNITQNTQEVVMGITDTIKDVEIDDTVAITQPVVGVVAVTSNFFLLNLFTSLGTNSISGLQFVSSFFVIGILKKKKQKYGLVYDSVTKEPLSTASVRILDELGKLITTVVTDIYGIFDPKIPDGRYKFEVKSREHVFPSNTVLGVSDHPYQNVYKGGIVNYNSQETLNISIPMDREDRNIFQKFFTSGRNIFIILLDIFTKLLFISGFIISCISLIQNQTLFFWLMFLIYVIAIVLILISVYKDKKSYGIVKTSQGSIVEGLEIGLRELEYNTLYAKRVTDEKGKYRFIVPGGKYRVEILNKEYRVIELSNDTFEIKDGSLYIINEDIIIKKV